MSSKPIICVLSVFLVILCITSTQCDVSHVVLGGESSVDTGTIELLRKNISDYLLELQHGGSPQMHLMQIYSASKQIVSGTLYTVDALLDTPGGAKKCQIRVLERPWADFCHVQVQCEHGTQYEVVINPNQISQDYSHQLGPVSNHLPTAFQTPDASQPQNPFLNQLTTTTHIQQQVSPLNTYLPPQTISVNPPHPFEYKPIQTPVYKPLPTLPPQPIYKPQPQPLPTLAPFKPQPVYKPLPTLPPLKQQPIYKPQPVFKPLPPLPPLKQQPIYKPQPQPLPTLAPFKSKPTYLPPTFKPQPPPTRPPPTLPPRTLPPQTLPPRTQPPPTLPPRTLPPQTLPPRTQPPPTLPPLKPQHDFPIKPTLIPKPSLPKPELNVLPEDKLPQGEALDRYLDDLFHKFMIKYDREYIDEPTEMGYRFNVFKENFFGMYEHSRVDREACEYSVTEFADLTDSEFSRILGFDQSLLNSTDSSSDGGSSDGGADEVEEPLDAETEKKCSAEHYDQRDDNLVTRVKFQGDCGACWAFVTSSLVEGMCAKRTKKLQEFSEQSLIDCDKSNYGCKGGVPPNAVKHIKNRGGLELESVYPYEFGQKSCRFNKKTVKAQVASNKEFKKGDEEGMKKWICRNGPISVAINADPLKYYKGGVLNPTPKLCNPKKQNHAVTIIGYGVEKNTSTGEKLPYWIVKNQWGSRFGEGGYFRIVRGKNACGLASWANSLRLADVPNNCMLDGA